jgi:Ca-activated chloride channel homolog
MPELHTVQFVWPQLLWLLTLLPLLALGLQALARQQRRQQGGLPSRLALPVGHGAHGGGRARRLLWWGLSGTGLALLVLALARPQALLLLPTRLDTLMLVIDSSGSMRADDVAPNRLEVARAAAQRLVERQPAAVRIGVISVAAAAVLVQPPTQDRDAVLRALQDLRPQPGSALGSGLVIALDAMLPGSGLDVRKLIDSGEAAPGPAGRPLPGAQVPAASQPFGRNAPRKAAPGSHRSGVIVLLSDGQANVGPGTLQMAALAADLGVRVHAVGIGTPQGAVLRAQGLQMRVRLEEAVLQQIAEQTRGQYLRGDDAQALRQVDLQLQAGLALREHRRTEITSVLAALGLLLLGAGASLRWWRYGRIV